MAPHTKPQENVHVLVHKRCPWLDAKYTPCMPEFSPRSCHIQFMVAALWQVSHTSHNFTNLVLILWYDVGTTNQHNITP
jgi:hypothetical protein